MEAYFNTGEGPYAFAQTSPLSEDNDSEEGVVDNMDLKSAVGGGVKKNLRYIAVLFVFFYIVPCIIMSQPRFPEIYPENWTVEQGFVFARIYWVCVWIGVPLSGGIIALRHVLADGQFCPILIAEAALAMPLHLLRMDAGMVLVLSLSVLIVLLMESFTLLGCYAPPPKERKPGLLGGAAKNRKFLALLCFWSVIIIGVLQIACKYLELWDEFVLPIILFPLPLILLFLPLFCLKEFPLTLGGLAGALLLFALSAVLSTTFYMNRFWKGHLYFVTVGFGLLLLMNGFLALARFLHIHVAHEEDFS